MSKDVATLWVNPLGTLYHDECLPAFLWAIEAAGALRHPQQEAVEKQVLGHVITFTEQDFDPASEQLLGACCLRVCHLDQSIPHAACSPAICSCILLTQTLQAQDQQLEPLGWNTTHHSIQPSAQLGFAPMAAPLASPAGPCLARVAFDPQLCCTRQATRPSDGYSSVVRLPQPLPLHKHPRRVTMDAYVIKYMDVRSTEGSASVLPALLLCLAMLLVLHAEALRDELLAVHDQEPAGSLKVFSAWYMRTNSHKLGIVQEYMDRGSLIEIMELCKEAGWPGVPELVVSYVMKELLIAMRDTIPRSLHSAKSYVEITQLRPDARLKPSDILVHSDGQVKLSEFSLANDPMMYERQHAVYMAPERIKGARYSTQSDVFGAALSMVHVALGYYPYGKGKLSFMQSLVNLESAPPVELPAGLSPVATEFFRAATQRLPTDRLSSEQALAHPFLVGNTFGQPEMAAWLKQVKTKEKPRFYKQPADMDCPSELDRSRPERLRRLSSDAGGMHVAHDGMPGRVINATNKMPPTKTQGLSLGAQTRGSDSVSPSPSPELKAESGHINQPQNPGGKPAFAQWTPPAAKTGKGQQQQANRGQQWD
eukprot:gene12601-2302_t